MKRKKLKKMIGRAVKIIWHDEDWDWDCFRVERIRRDKIALTGMINDKNVRHSGDFFWADIKEIKSITLRE